MKRRRNSAVKYKEKNEEKEDKAEKQKKDVIILCYKYFRVK